MNTSRRAFLASAPLLAGAGALAASAQEGEKVEAALKLASQEGRIPGNSLAEKVGRMAEWGFVGLEVWGGGLETRVEEIRKALDGTPVAMSAICAGFASCLIHNEEAKRRECVDSAKVILTAAGELASTGLIMVPAFNGQTNLGNFDARPILVDILKELGEFAHNAGTRILLEPLNRGECFFLRQVADAAAICRDVDSPGVCVMGDFFHMCIEETSDMGAFLSGGAYLHHVHLASRRRVLPGQDERSFVDGFRGLKWIGYQDFCSLECGCDGDPMVEVPKAVAFLKDQWTQA